MNTPLHHPSLATLLDYWLHDSDAATTDAVDEHLFACEACGRRLDDLVALSDGVRAAFRAGTVAVVASGAFVQRLTAQGGKVRTYRLPHNGSVNCTVAPEDELLVSHLEVPLQGVARVDAQLQLSLEPGVLHRLHDIPFDPQAGAVVFLPKLAQIRPLPAHTLEVTLVAVAPDGQRPLGHYTFHHRPWPGLPGAAEAQRPPA